MFRFDIVAISQSKGCRRAKRWSPPSKLPKRNYMAVKAPLNQFSEKLERGIVAQLPLRAVNEANSSEHWSKSSKRHRQQKSVVAAILRQYQGDIKLPCTITLTRYGGRKLDKFDNLPMSFKWILDSICEVITGDYRAGIADNKIEDQLDVIYRQQPYKQTGIRIEINY